MQTTLKVSGRILKRFLPIGTFTAITLALASLSFYRRVNAQDPMDDDMDMQSLFRPIGTADALVGDSVASPGPDPSFESLNYPGALASVAYDINNSGHIVGVYEDANLNFHGFVYNPVARQYESIDYDNPVCTTG